MKKIVLKITAILLILASAFACGKGNEKTQTLDLGIYIETYPIEGHASIDFIDRKKLAINTGSINEFYYTINEEEKTIELTLIAEPSLGGGMVNGFYFKIINSSKFEIGNLYPSPLLVLPSSSLPKHSTRLMFLLFALVVSIYPF